MASEAEVAAELVHDRVDQEWALKESLERRAQFLVGTAATSSSVIVAAVALFVRNGVLLKAAPEVLLAVAVGLEVAVGVLAAVALLPLTLRTIERHALTDLVSSAATDQATSAIPVLTSRSNAEVRLLQALERQNGFKALLVFLATVMQAATIAVLGIAVIETIRHF